MRGEATAAFGGDGASIAQMYICTACRGYPCPQRRLRAEDAETGKMDYILACDRNRIFRGQSLRHLLAYEDRLHTCGVDILYPYEII